MEHISLAQAYDLAKYLLNDKQLDDELAKVAQHIKKCDKCYELYSIAMAVQDLTTPEVIADAYFEHKRNPLSVISIIRDKVNRTLSAMQEYAKDVNWQFDYQPSFAGARGTKHNIAADKLLLKNANSKYSQIIVRENSLYMTIEDDGKSYIAECITDGGEKYIEKFKYDEYEDMLIAEFKNISSDSYTLRIVEGENDEEIT